MDAIKDYLISITAAAIITGIVTGITKKSGSISAMIRLLSGLFMAVTILYPVVDIQFSSLRPYLDQMSIDGDYAADLGKKAAEEEMKQFITERSCAYILDKAAAFGADLEVEVYLQDFVPCGVQISGAVSPYAKQQISQYISSNLGISLEEQRWIG